MGTLAADAILATPRANNGQRQDQLSFHRHNENKSTSWPPPPHLTVEAANSIGIFAAIFDFL